MTDSLFKARVTAGHGRHHYVEDDAGHLFEARRRGKKNDVTVGDYVECRQADSETVAVEAVLPRKTLLFRSDEWRVKELAANVDLVAVVFASRPTFNPWFVWKAVVAAKTAGIGVVAIRNKADLTEGREACDAFAASLPAAGCPCLTLSAYDADDVLTKLTPLLENKTTLLIGQSGMGKSTLINVLCPEAQAKTREFSEALDLGKPKPRRLRAYTARSLPAVKRRLLTPRAFRSSASRTSRGAIFSKPCPILRNTPRAAAFTTAPTPMNRAARCVRRLRPGK